ncbi:MAG: YfhO family protein [Planctomycetes bacterium]|nr:YfhO family protein [Planctomycetota bacterium]
MDDLSPRPTRRELLAALILAACCALGFLREGVLPTRALLPFVPERYAPLGAEAEQRGELPDRAELRAGNVSLGDKYNQSLAWDRILQDRLRDGELPLWTNHIAGGAPFVPQMAQVYQPWNLLLLGPWPSAGWYGISYFLHLVLWGLGAWYFLRRIGLLQPAALLGLCCAVLGLWTQARIHHNVILSAALPLWPLLTIVHGAFARRGPGPAGIGAIGLLLGISWSGGFAPVSLQTTALVLALALATAATSRRARPLLGIGAGFALGGLVALAQMGPTLLASTLSAREAPTPEQLAAIGLSSRHLASLVWPDLLHWPARAYQAPTFAALRELPAFLDPAVAGRFNWSETAVSIGLPAALLVPLAALTRARVAVGVCIAAGALAFGLATAKSPFLELSGVLPGARAGDLRRFLYLASIGLTVAAAAGADVLLRRPAVRVLPAVLALAGAAVTGALLLRWALPFATDEQFAADWAARLGERAQLPAEIVRAAMDVRPTEIADNHAMQVWCASRVTIVAVLAALVLVVPLRPARRVHVLLVLTAVELLLAGAGTFVAVPVARVVHPPTTLAPVIDATARAAPGDVPRLVRLVTRTDGVSIDLWPPNLGAYHRIEDLSAYDPLPPARMEQTFLAIEPDRPGKPSAVLHGAGVLAFFDPATLAHPLLDVLGARYVLTDRSDVALSDRLIDATPPATPAPFRLLERTTTLPRATFVDTALPVLDGDTAFLSRPGFDPRRAVHLAGPGAPALGGDGHPDADVEVVARTDERVAVRVTAREPGILRLADPYDPGWRATLDGAPVPIFVADHYLRAVEVPPGDHRVEFRYAGREVWLPRLAAALGVAACLALLAIALLSRPPRGGRSERSIA